jgi:16S rRNA (cytosine967-C5)-methyltransferase
VATAARRLALRVLQDVAAGGFSVAERLGAEDASGLDPRDRGFLHELVLGTLRHRGLLDHALLPLVSRALEELDPVVLQVLRLGAYQLLRLRVPHRAAVSESVDLVATTTRRAAGLVNAVLRRLAREGPPPVPDPVVDAPGWLTTEGSLPDWLARRWFDRLGPATAVDRARAFLDVPPATFRFNPRLASRRERARIQAALGTRRLIVPESWEATAGRPADVATRAAIYLQDQGSQLVARLAARPGRVLDACAAPGGKSTLIADAIGDSVAVTAADASQGRVRSMARLVARWGSTNVRVLAADAMMPPFGVRFDAVLLDAPCSGLGTLGRHPDIRWRTSENDLQRQTRRQSALLDSVAALVAPGGLLVYATCSAETEENEGPVEYFLPRHPEFEPASGPDWATPFREGSYYRTRPERDGGDAFFAALLARR